MKLSDKYTTNDKITTQEADKETDPKEKTEKTKTIVSNDAYVLSEMVECLNANIASIIRSFAK